MTRFVVYKDKSDEWRWRFRADNDKIIADSGEGYVNKQDCRNAIGILKRQASAAEIVEI